MSASGKGKALIVGEDALVAELAALLGKSDWEIAWYRLEQRQPAADRSAIARDQMLEELAGLAAGATVAVETLLWPVERKRELLQAVDLALPRSTALATLALSRSTTELASWTTQPRRVVGVGLLPPLADQTLI